MGRHRAAGTSDADYARRRKYYLDNREARLAAGKRQYERIRPFVTAAMKQAIRQARSTRLEDRRLAMYAAQGKTAPGTAAEKARAFVQMLKTNTPCADCRKSFHFCAMDFDHISGTKTRDISDLVGKGRSLAAITRELAKCEVVCANCHRLRTFQRATLLPE